MSSISRNHRPPYQSAITHYASPGGGRIAFGVGTGFVSIASNIEAPLLAIDNPSTSGKDIYFDIGEFAANQNTQFRRYVGGSLSSLGTPETARNLGGGTASSALRLYVPGQYTASSGTVGKVAFIQAFDTYFTQLNGRLVLRPGRSVYWTIDGSGGNLQAAVYFEYWELNAQ